MAMLGLAGRLSRLCPSRLAGVSAAWMNLEWLFFLQALSHKLRQFLLERLLS